MWANKPATARKWAEEHGSKIKKAAFFDELQKIAKEGHLDKGMCNMVFRTREPVYTSSVLQVPDKGDSQCFQPC